MEDNFFELVVASLAGGTDTQLADIYNATAREMAVRGLIGPQDVVEPTVKVDPWLPPGTRVKVNNHVSPAYLRGLTGTVINEEVRTTPKGAVLIPVRFDKSLPTGRFNKGSGNSRLNMPKAGLDKISSVQ